MRSTHTYATLEVDKIVIDSIVAALEKAGHEYVDRYVEKVDGRIVIHMPDVGLVALPERPPPVDWFGGSPPIYEASHDRLL